MKKDPEHKNCGVYETQYGNWNFHTPSEFAHWGPEVGAVPSDPIPPSHHKESDRFQNQSQTNFQEDSGKYSVYDDRPP